MTINIHVPLHAINSEDLDFKVQGKWKPWKTETGKRSLACALLMLTKVSDVSVFRGDTLNMFTYAHIPTSVLVLPQILCDFLLCL
jgi:hypothetical protein